MAGSTGSFDEETLIWTTERLGAEIRKSVDPSIFEYAENRRRGIIPPNEEPGWGYQSSGRREVARRINQKLVTWPFYDIDFGNGYTGRGGKPMRCGRVLSTIILINVQ